SLGLYGMVLSSAKPIPWPWPVPGLIRKSKSATIWLNAPGSVRSKAIVFVPAVLVASSSRRKFAPAGPPPMTIGLIEVPIFSGLYGVPVAKFWVVWAGSIAPQINRIQNA